MKFNMGLIITLILIGLMTIGVITLQIYMGGYGRSQDQACIEIGYNEYFDGKCIGEENYVEVYIDCDQSFKPKCRVLEKEFQ